MYVLLMRPSIFLYIWLYEIKMFFILCVSFLYRYLATELSSMTDQERDLIDNAAQDIIKQCSELINRVQSTSMDR